MTAHSIKQRPVRKRQLRRQTDLEHTPIYNQIHSAVLCSINGHLRSTHQTGQDPLIQASTAMTSRACSTQLIIWLQLFCFQLWRWLCAPILATAGFMISVVFTTLLVLPLMLPADAESQQTPELMLANSYHGDIDISRYYVSEKYDGFRAYWNGRELLSRSGHRFALPASFTKNFPSYPLDGELWLGREQFEQTASIVQSGASDPRWSQMRFMVFDAPKLAGSFQHRLEYLQKHLADLDNAHLTLAPQRLLASEQALFSELERILLLGGEGLMLHRADSLYTASRSDNLLKVKQHQDAEARVIAHLPGRGQLEGQTGALLVERADGVRFKIGSGLSAAERANPPPVDSIITYRFNGLYQSGIPRFARFLRVRPQI